MDAALRGATGLLERDDTLAAIGDVLEAAVAGAAPALLISRDIRGWARRVCTRRRSTRPGRRGVRVLRAAGAELEQNLAFGVAGQLVRALLSDLPTRAAVAFLSEAPERGALASPGPARTCSIPRRSRATSRCRTACSR